MELKQEGKTPMLNLSASVREKLVQLRRVVEAVPERKLEMSEFSTEGPCGTAFCAAGHAAHDPWFQSQGFKWNDTGCGFPIHETDDKHYGGTEAVRSFFELPGASADALFAMRNGLVGSNDVSKAQVLQNIDRLLAGQPAHSYWW